MDVTIFAAFLAGLISFLSPCVLPLVPGYLSIISGFSLDQLKDEQKQGVLKRSVVLNSVMFIIGFSITFITLGASATVLGQFLMSRMQLLYRIAGLIIIIFGLHLTGIFKINFLYQDKRLHNVGKPRGMWGALVLGLAFAFGWSPCIGPILAGILAIAGTKQSVLQGVLLLAVYSAGLGVPFLLTSLGLNRFLSFYSRFKRHFHAVEVTSGVLVMAVGVLILTNNLSRMAGWFTFLNDFVLYLESFIA
ncbi:MAG: cytochrome c biogenesis protein CcdA [Acidobacteria bacterium]|nr:cytochrome c biogenesis protein CcdA [Acidobacteriota bacterium]